jgi:endonuclease-3
MSRLRRRFADIYDRLYRQYGDCGCPLRHDSPFQLAVAVLLSAQCRDDRVNQVTPELFRLAPDAAALARLPAETVAGIIRTCGLFNAKSRHLRALAELLVRDFGGELPRTMAELTVLPGIGRKSANVILGNAFDTPGFPVDTHVNRVLNRLGVVAVKDPEKIERIVNAEVPPERWTNFSHLLIRHGRDVCHAARPDCAACLLRSICRYAEKKASDPKAGRSFVKDRLP